GVCSRRHAEDLIRAGRIFMNGKKALLGDKTSGKEDVLVDGKKIQIKHLKKKVIAFYKPRGVECTLSPNRGAITLLDFDFGSERIFPIGRLDKDSHGLLLLTNDGDLGNALAHPSFEQEKEYLVVIKGIVTEDILKKLKAGIIVNGKQTVPCHIEGVGKEIFRFILHEGRNRQIRKMCEAVGLEVKDLLRIRVGNVSLGEMREGKWRILSDREVETLKKTKI
ncbi:rRNA pseudouridine synthase, partial [Candidatus Gracilibacteria bacterium]|nr:rRNA pseudouridine synthase [Candidatus Gracilibacteria bacterium]